MAWTEITRRQYVRIGCGYASGMMDAEWLLIAPFMPGPKRLGRKRTADMRRVADAIFYIACSGCQWRMLPKDLPPGSTVQGYFYLWRDTGTGGLLAAAIVHEASIQDRDGAVPLIASMKKLCPWLRHRIAGGGHAGPKLKEALGKLGKWTIEIIKRSDRAKGFVLLPKRWAPDRVRGRTHPCLAWAQPQACQRLRSHHRQRDSVGLHRQRPPYLKATRKSLKSRTAFQVRL